MRVNPLKQARLDVGCIGNITFNTILERWYKTFQSALLDMCPASLWHDKSYRAGCPIPIVITKYHQEQLVLLHEALTTAIDDIVCRWWTDSDARFLERMPLEKKEEDILKWIDLQVSEGNMRMFSDCMGSWRPDFLVEMRGPTSIHQEKHVEESFIITEINARFSFNGFMHEAYGQQATCEVFRYFNSEVAGFENATDPSKIVDGLFSLIQPNRRLHLLKDQEAGIDIHMFIHAVFRRFGIKPKLIKPSELRLLPDSHGTMGFRLYCVTNDSDNDEGSPRITDNGETLEEIHQIGLELHQRELDALAPEMLRQISLRCFNDMRTILLVHDKRMLGIVRQEVPNLLARQVLSQAQADALRRGIVETLLPNSSELRSLLQTSKNSAQLRNEYILKPIRSGKGHGIVFGEDLSPAEWLEKLEKLQSLKAANLQASCVVQRRVVPQVYDLILRCTI